MTVSERLGRLPTDQLEPLTRDPNLITRQFAIQAWIERALHRDWLRLKASGRNPDDVRLRFNARGGLA